MITTERDPAYGNERACICLGNPDATVAHVARSRYAAVLVGIRPYVHHLRALISTSPPRCLFALLENDSACSKMFSSLSNILQSE